MSRSRDSYKSLTIKRKLEIINIVEKAPAGRKKKELATEFNIAVSTLSSIIKNKDSLKVRAISGGKGKKRNRDLTWPDVDEAWYIWFSVAWAQSIPISGKMLKAKAEELSTGDYFLIKTMESREIPVLVEKRVERE